MTAKIAPPPGISYLADNIITKQNIFGSSREARASWAKGLSFSGDASTIFFAGCGYQYMGQLDQVMSLVRKLDTSVVGADLPLKLANVQKKLGFDGLLHRVMGGKDGSGEQVLRDAVKVLQRLGIEFGYLGADEPCCGGLLYFSGRHRDFAANAARLFDRFKSAGVKRIIGIVPSCTYALRDIVPQFVKGYDLEVKHFSEAVLESLGPVELSLPEPMKVTYHDPCQMARYLRIVTPPREILRRIKGLELVEPDFTAGEWATCCGGGAGFEAVFPELSEILATNRVKELVSTGAEAIVTQCPGCIMQLRHGLQKLGQEKIKIFDLAEVLALALRV